ncbi:hypothetical protein C8R42DRAFT_715627 [Lentinula raphanica]|nr:hypothetical protein C8R42DRAFT_715627 [Lentinula raphanica]
MSVWSISTNSLCLPSYISLAGAIVFTIIALFSVLSYWEYRPPPIINVAARQHPVTVHSNRRTVSDYITEAIKKTTKIHTRLPPGGILIFLTGQHEIQGVRRKREAKFSKTAIDKKNKWRMAGSASRIFSVDDTVSDEVLDRTVASAFGGSGSAFSNSNNANATRLTETLTGAAQTLARTM